MKEFVNRLLSNYEESKGFKKILWISFCVIITLVLLPLLFLVVPTILGLAIGLMGLLFN